MDIALPKRYLNQPLCCLPRLDVTDPGSVAALGSLSIVQHTSTTRARATTPVLAPASSSPDFLTVASIMGCRRPDRNFENIPQFVHPPDIFSSTVDWVPHARRVASVEQTFLDQRSTGKSNTIFAMSTYFRHDFGHASLVRGKERHGEAFRVRVRSFRGSTRNLGLDVAVLALVFLFISLPILSFQTPDAIAAWTLH
ncbi:hypothetical protein OF83DRAFT_1086492 [Amylostereum chailletii]|nr:hypothetical protein OF83DRAFT_1086492 [Amylostereum chailletii]